MDYKPISGKPLNSIDISIDSISSSSKTKFTVPVKKHIPIASVFLVTFGSIFGSFAISQFAGLIGSFSTGLTSYLVEITNWDSYVAQAVLGIILLIMAVVIFKAAGKVMEWSNKVKSIIESRIDKSPDSFVLLNIVPPAMLIKEFENRGCKKVIDPDGQGFGIYCQNYPYTKEMYESLKGSGNAFSIGSQLTIILFLNVCVLLPLIFIREGTLDLVIGPWIWYIFMIIVLLIFLEANLLPLWVCVISYSIHILIAMIFVPEVLLIVNIAFPGAIIFFGLALILYLFKSEQCLQETNWWCDRL